MPLPVSATRCGDVARVSRDGDRDHAAAGRELDGVREQVPQNLDQPILVAHHVTGHVGEVTHQS